MQTVVHMQTVRGAVVRWLLAVTHHYQLHQPEHVGAFAGSLLQRKDWDHG
jgi:hypothetical protein